MTTTRREHVEPSVEAVVVEANPRGHRLVYVGLLGHELGAGRWMLVTSPGVEAATEYVQHVAPCAPHAVVELTGGTRTLLRAALRVAERAGAGSVVIPDADRYLPAIVTSPRLWTRSAPRVRCLVMRTPSRGSGVRGTLRVAVKVVLAYVVSRMPGVQTWFLTDAFGAVDRRPLYPGLRPVPDPVRAPVPSHASPPPWTTALATVGVVGTVASRKNVELLVEAARREGGTAVVLAGRLDDTLRTVWRTSPVWAEMIEQGRLVVMDRYLSGPEFDAAVRALGAVAVLHDNDAPSGILGEAAARGVPAIVPEDGWLGDVARSTGAAVTTRLTEADVASALTRVREDAPRLRRRAESAAARLGSRSFVLALTAGVREVQP